MIVLSAATYVLQLTLSAGTADVDVSYVDRTATAYPIGATEQTAATATTQTICSAPAASTSREIDFLSVKIKTTGGVVTVQKLNSSGSVTTQLISVTLLDEEVLVYTHGSGWKAIDASGNEKTALSGAISGTSLAITGNATIGGTLGVTGTTTLSAALTYGGVTLSNSVTGTGNMVLSASPTFTGTVSAAAITASGTFTGRTIIPDTNAAYSVGSAAGKYINVFATGVSDGATATGQLLSSSSTTVLLGAGSDWTSVSLGSKSLTAGAASVTTLAASSTISAKQEGSASVLSGITMTNAAGTYGSNWQFDTSGNGEFWSFDNGGLGWNRVLELGKAGGVSVTGALAASGNVTGGGRITATALTANGAQSFRSVARTTSEDSQIAFYRSDNTTSQGFFNSINTGLQWYGPSSTLVLSATDTGLDVTGTLAASGRISGGSALPIGEGVNMSLNTSTGSNARFYNSHGDATPAVLFDKSSTTDTTSQVFVAFTINAQATGSGQINANGASAAAFGTFSDRTLKENITDLPSQRTAFRALRPVEFDYIKSEGGGHQIGFVAQEMATVYPDVVGPRADGKLMVTGWGKTESRFVKYVQEIDSDVQNHESRLAELEAFREKAIPALAKAGITI